MKGFKKQDKKGFKQDIPADLLGKLPPQALDVEEGVLAAMLVEGKMLIEILPLIKSEDLFHKEAHRMLFLAIRELFSAGVPVDLLTVTQELRKRGELEIIGGVYFLTHLAAKVSSAANVYEWIEILKEKALLRDMIDFSTVLHREAFDDSSDPAALLDLMALRVLELQDGILTGKNTNGRSIYLETMKLIAKAMESPGMTGVPTGLTELDKMMGGWQKDDLVIVAARPGMGKTALLTSSLKHAVLVEKKTVGVFTLEMSSTQLMLRMIADESQVSGAKMKKGYTTPEEYVRIQETTANLFTDNLQIDDTPAISITELRAKALRWKMKYPDLCQIWVDYLQLMRSVKNHGIREQEISEISRGLKQIAKELGIPVIALSQLSRAVESRGGDKRPQLSDLRESGAIEQDADEVIFIYRPEYYKIEVDENGNSLHGIAEFIFAKNRHGPCQSVVTGFDGPTTSFYNLDSPPVKPEVIVSSGNQFGYSDPTESRKETAFDNFSVNDFENNSTSKKDDGAPF